MATLKEIVEQRLEQLKISPIEAATKAGIERTFIRDIVEDRKKSIRADKIGALAEALSLDAAALAHGQLVPSLPKSFHEAIGRLNETEREFVLHCSEMLARKLSDYQLTRVGE